MTRSNLAFDSHRYYDIKPSSPSLHNSIGCKQLLIVMIDSGLLQNIGRELCSNAWLVQGLRENCGGNSLHVMAMHAVWTSCQLSQLASQHNHSDLSLRAQDNALKWWYKKKTAFQEQKISKSAKAKVNKQLESKCHQLSEQTIHTICAAKEIQVYGTEKVTTNTQRQFQVHMNRVRQAATNWADAHW